MAKLNYNSIDKQRIESSIKMVEEQTNGEIVPVVFKKSDNYPGSHLRCAILFGMLFPIALYLIPIDFGRPELYVYVQIIGLALGYLLAYRPSIKRLFCTFGEMKEEVYQRSVQAFMENGLHLTKENNGVLVAISLLERKIEILADKGINEKVSKDTWKNITKIIAKDLKSGSINDALVDAIQEVGKHLKEHYPKTECDQDELSNQLLLDGVKDSSEDQKTENAPSENPTAPSEK
ncbi:MAG: hypothetical protein GY909_09455 [Oligoflexia bacterium]|nr:hypothetical protein [Oligoflexia bacterium]